MYHKKGQGWSVDFLIFLTFISVLLMVFIVVWNHLIISWDVNQEFRSSRNDVLVASQLLATSSGNPLNWYNITNITNEDSQITSLGIMAERNVVDNAKLERLLSAVDEDYYLVRNRLGIRKGDFLVTIYEAETNITYYSFGKPPTANNTIATSERLVILNGSITNLKLEVWK